MSSWKLVEAVVDKTPEDIQQGDAKTNKKHGNQNGNRGKQLRNPQMVEKQSRDYYAHLTVQQIEYLFSDQNLAMDTYMRFYMDEQGFVPIVLLYSYPHVSCYGTPFDVVVQKMTNKVKNKADYFLEMDHDHLTVRLKERFEMWLMPNERGGRGLALYSEQPVVTVKQIMLSMGLTGYEAYTESRSNGYDGYGGYDNSRNEQVAAPEDGIHNLDAGSLNASEASNPTGTADYAANSTTASASPIRSPNRLSKADSPDSPALIHDGLQTLSLNAKEFKPAVAPPAGES